ncbi:hypothetical protein BOTBODRAFT_58516 [Botryobasidium botryosum FD-172 SS1]|uniref:Secreted protein n=1 Tax=Botryobasidium botryosum (strain FD-172 SS1) TaxID=930990 RepID=A0A067MDU5_BOTB1|nr:hypothetical protein BOTBODRAFT_58516 [Botryobasidium botryosum FD-172 SS1]
MSPRPRRPPAMVCPFLIASASALVGDDAAPRAAIKRTLPLSVVPSANKLSQNNRRVHNASLDSTTAANKQWVRL